MAEDKRSTIHDLLDIMAKLRAPDGCPWDQEQDHHSLVRYLIEEAYEVVDAIEAEDDDEMCGELGDLLLQIVFHAQLAKERKAFDFTDVSNGICKKLIHRHPHVFRPEETESVATSEEVLSNWEKIKQKERGEKSSALDGLPSHLPGLLLAQRMQEKAAGVGFDWKNDAGVIEKIREELQEVESAMEGQKAEEIGDLLFSVVNLARHYRLSAEDCLRQSTAKFKTRFQSMESEVQASGQQLSDLSEAELDVLWNQAKSSETRSSSFPESEENAKPIERGGRRDHRP